MDITTIDAVSFATRVGQMAAAELYGLLASEEAAFQPGWFDLAKYSQIGDDDFLADLSLELSTNVSALGQYVCLNQVDQGERLFRWGQMKAIVPSGDWAVLDVAGKQAFEAFALTTRHTYLGLAVAQQAIKNARAAAGVPTTLKREDSIFEETESLGTIRPEAIEASGLAARMEREGAAELQRQEDIAWAAMWDEAEAENLEWNATRKKATFAEKMAAAKAAKRATMSAGETLVQQQPNKGGRGKKNPDPPSS